MEEPTEKCRRLRYALAPYIDEFVLGTGWITDWKDKGKNRRYFVSNPIIKVANKDILFKDQQLISKEHHINLFIPLEDLSKCKFKIEMYSEITFGGVIRKYTRKDGTSDFGVYPLPQSTLEHRLNRMHNTIDYVSKEEGRYSKQMLLCLENYVKRELRLLENDLDRAGNLLPTFNGTYKDYKEEITQWKIDVDEIIKCIRSVCSNRKMRRLYKVPYNFAAEIPSFA